MLDIEKGKWSPIRISRSGPNVSYFFFVDDLVIFCKVELEQARLLQSILNHFCDFSEHKISTKKSNIFFSEGTDHGLADHISHLLGFHEVQDLGTNLGVPLLHDRVTNSTSSFIVEKVHCKLRSWTARELSIAGKVTLAQSILLSIPNYFMQSLRIPKRICTEIERLVHQFI